MMKKILVTISLCFLLTGCSSPSISNDKAYSGNGINSVSDSFGMVEEMDSGYSKDTTADFYEENSKIIVEGGIEVETKNFADTYNSFVGLVNAYGGYFSSSYEWSSYNQATGDYDGNKHGEYSIKIPAEKYNDFVFGLESKTKVVRKNITTKDVTDEYYDLKTRIEAKELERDRVMDFYKQASSIDDLIKLEERLSDINMTIDRYKGSFQLLENRTSYSTLNIEINEVNEYTIARTSRTFGEQIVDEFKGGCEKTLRFLQDIALFVVGNLWFILFVGIVFVALRYLAVKKNIRIRIKFDSFWFIIGSIVVSAFVSTAMDIPELGVLIFIASFITWAVSLFNKRKNGN